MAKIVKTNVMRLLEEAKIAYTEHTYSEEIVDGEGVASALQEDPSCVFKSLVCENEKKEHFVFEVPVNTSLNLKKAAKAAHSKSISMIPQKELLPLTGYVHGGCSPIGLKKQFPVFIDETAQLFDKIYISGGKRGFQVGISPLDLQAYTHGSFADLME
ncbi:MAG: Cys-tRNA(Pro) deacylase [Erysipelotrichaceae bacterium]|nr:Cys-tRNA(Pro) deacylase [Erysipelotrichaceae bacterium]